MLHDELSMDKKEKKVMASFQQVVIAPIDLSLIYYNHYPSIVCSVRVCVCVCVLAHVIQYYVHMHVLFRVYDTSL